MTARKLSRKTYGQFCGLARAMDHLGDRWTLLVVRELLASPCTFRELHESLAGISPNLLVERLHALTADGLVGRSDDPARSKRVTYALTAEGRGLEPALLELIRWGARYMVSGPGQDRVDARWALLALRALLEGPSPFPGRTVTAHLNIAGQPVTITDDGQLRRVTIGHSGQADASLDVTMPDVLAVAAGLQPATSITRGATGGRRRLEAALTPRRTTPPIPSGAQPGAALALHDNRPPADTAPDVGLTVALDRSSDARITRRTGSGVRRHE